MALASAPSTDLCPRVERARRMWTGFAIDVASEEMALALDVVVPIQVRLGELFCEPSLADCRPDELLKIELADARPSAARVTLTQRVASAQRDRDMLLLFVAQQWVFEPNSLAAYLAACRAHAASQAP